MKQLLFFLFSLLAITASAQSSIASLGTIRNRLVQRNLEVKAYFYDGSLSRVELECPISDYAVGTIAVKADDLQRFRDIMGKIRSGMAVFTKQVEQNEYGEVSTAFDNVNTKVTYKWDGIRQEKDGDLEIVLTHDKNGKYTSSIRHKAFDDTDNNFVGTFFMQFRSLYEIDYLLVLISDENIAISSKKDDLLLKIHKDIQ